RKHVRAWAPPAVRAPPQRPCAALTARYSAERWGAVRGNEVRAWPPATRMTARGSATTTEPRMQTAAAMQTARPDPARELGPEERATQYTLGSSVCDDIAEVVREVRAALREGRY